MKLSAKNIFLLDGLGALTTSIFLSLLLPRFEDFFGVPTHVLFPLASIAFLYAIYSLVCQFTLRNHFNSLLKVIIVANLIYSALTAILLVVKHEVITVFGFVYFIGEIGIILFLVSQEIQILKNEER